jgi:hypothetical protein
MMSMQVKDFSVAFSHGAQRLPIAILSFDRPHYLQQVLLSLQPQVDRQDCIILFQDGAWNPFSRQFKANPDAIAECIRLFRTIFPSGIVAASDCNFGIAQNYERAEQEIFGRMEAPYGLFLEDDLVLSPNYLNVTRMLLDLAKRDKRIAYVSAYGNFWASLQDQEAQKRKLIHMHENWGFAMTRNAWLAERPFRLEYLRLLEGIDYTLRDPRAIIQFYARRGWKTSISSQDAARWIASAELGKVRLTTFPCHARYIGAVGLHSTKETYAKAQFAGATFFTGDPARPDRPTNKQYEAWLAAERKRFTTEPKSFYANHATGTYSRSGEAASWSFKPQFRRPAWTRFVQRIFARFAPPPISGANRDHDLNGPNSH